MLFVLPRRVPIHLPQTGGVSYENPYVATFGSNANSCLTVTQQESLRIRAVLLDRFKQPGIAADRHGLLQRAASHDFLLHPLAVFMSWILARTRLRSA
jgi:hypothetical protein